MFTDGNRRRMRELTRTPTWLWGSARAYVPIETPRLLGQLRLEVTTMGTGWLRFDAQLPDGSRLVLRFTRARFPYAMHSRTPQPPLQVDAGDLDRLEETRENVEVGYSRALGPRDGRLEVSLDFQRFAGTRPLLSGGGLSDSPLEYSFGNPAYRRTDDLSGGAFAAYSLAPGGIRLRLAGGVRLDRTKDRLLIRDRLGDQALGLADMRDKERRRTIELTISAQSDRPTTLMAGASYRLQHQADGPRVDRTFVNTQGSNGTMQSHDADVTILRQHGALGAVWQPIPRLRFSGRVEARWTDLDGHANQGRDLGTFQIVHTEVERDSWSLNGRADGRLDFLARNAVELEARGGLRRGPDDWDLRYFLADGATLAGQRLRNLDRHLLVGSLELRLVSRLFSRVRITAGARAEGLSDERDTRFLVDAFQLGNRSRRRFGGFLAARATPFRRLLVDGRATLFQETWNNPGAHDESWRFDVRLRASMSLGWLTLFAIGSLTEDRHDMSGALDAQPGFNTLDFTGRSWFGLAGATVNAMGGWITGTYSVVVNTVDLTTRLQDAALTGNWRLPWRGLRVSASGRFLDFHDRQLTWDNGRAWVLLAGLAGSF